MAKNIEDLKEEVEGSGRQSNLRKPFPRNEAEVIVEYYEEKVESVSEDDEYNYSDNYYKK